MSKIVPKLDLNKTPQSVENNSLVYARNIKLLHDGKIVPDGAFDAIRVALEGDNSRIYGFVPGLHNKIYFFCHDLTANPPHHDNYYKDIIIEYDEVTKRLNRIVSDWSYSGGEITGCVTINNTGNKILTVCEYGEGLNVPIKHIPINGYSWYQNPNDSDAESLYTQHPYIPFIQLKYIGYNNNSIRSGVYQFFVRYKTKQQSYTNWFPATNDLYSAKVEVIPTIQGGVSYCYEQYNGAGFDFNITILNDSVKYLFSEVEIGCIISTDGASVARLWKSFDINELIGQDIISFGYESGELKEIDIDDILRQVYGLYNVSNIDVLNNTLYVANYNEDNHPNNKLQAFANDLRVSIQKKSTNYDTFTDDSYSLDFVTKSFYEPGSVYKYRNIAAGTGTIAYTAILFDLSKSSDGSDTFGWDDYQKVPSWVTVKSNPWSEPITETIHWDTGDVTVKKIKEINGVTSTNLKTANNGRVAVSFEGNCYIPQYNVYNYLSIFYVVLENIVTRDLEYRFLIIPDNNTNTDIIIDDTVYKTEEEIRNIVYGEIVSVVKTDKSSEENMYDVLDDIKTKSISGTTKTPSGIIFRKGFIDYCIKDIISVELDKWDDKSGADINITEDFLDLGFNNQTRGTGRITCTSINWFRTTIYVNNITINTDVLNVRTLLPEINYEFFLHFVKKNGIVTKGYKIPTGEVGDEYVYTTSYKSSLLNGGVYVLEPKLNLDNIDSSRYEEISEYDYCFISIKDVSQNRFLDLVHDDAIEGFFYAIETNALLDNNVNSFVSVEGYKGHYIDGNNIETFGAISGVVFVRHNNPHLYVVSDNNNNNNNDNNNNKLIKISPYINLRNLNKADEWYLPSFITQNIIPTYTLTRRYYVVDTEINTIHENKVLDTTELENTLSKRFTRYSKWNTTLLSVVGGLNKTRFKTWQESNGTKTKSIKTIINTINSQEISTFLQLSNTFRDFIKPSYTKWIENEEEYSRFDNIVRRSTVYDSEVKHFMYEFLPNEYYAIPNDKGDIVYLFTSGDTLLIHLTETLCKLNLDNTIKTATENNLSIEEADMFKQAVSFVKDSRLGFAGLNDKKDTIVTEDFYMFFDKVANRLYLYDNQQLQDISLPFLKLLKLLSPTGVRITYDRHCNRFYINFITTNNSLCVSYSLYSNGFVSLHDIDYNDVITTRVNSYLLNNTNDNKTIFKITNKKTKGTQYPNELLKPISYFKLSDNQIDQDVDTDRSSVIDIICNTEYEKIKVLNYIQWICKVTDKYDELDNDIDDIAWSDLEKILVSEEQSELYCGNKIRVYSDQTYTPLLTLTTNRQDAYGVEEQPMGGYQDPSTTENEVYPRNNNGIWTLNDFRDVRQIKTTQLGNTDNSLIHGKYFVIRLMFKNNYFNLENVIFNIDNYEKV